MTLRRGMAVLLALSLGLMGLGPVEALTPGQRAALFGARPHGKILLADGHSFLLLSDGASKLCRAGGC